MLRKITFLLIIFFSFISLYSQEGQDWKWSHMKPQGNTLRWVKMWDNNNWYAVGYAGTFMKTTNAGSSWTIHHQAGTPNTGGYTNDIYDAYFRNLDTGFVVGTNGVMTTVDGGQTFQPLATPLPTGTCYKAYMLNTMVGYIAGTSTVRIAKTTDGGFSWTINTVITSATYYDVWSPDENLIIATTTTGNIRRSTDAGLTWTTISTGVSATLYNVKFRDANTGFVAGSVSSIRMTTDAGLTWTSINTGIPASITFYDLDLVGNDIYLTGESYNLYKSSDNGTSWTPVGFLAPVSQQPWTAAYYSTHFLSDRFVVVGTYGLINQKIGSGTPTIYTEFRKPGTLYDVWAESGTGKVIAVGSPGITNSTFDQVMYSTNGGTNWQIGTLADAPQNINTQAQVVPEFINEDFESNSDGFSPTSSATFRTIDMINSNLGYIAGTVGAVYRTTNGGLNWDSIATPAPTTVTFYDMDFVSHLTGWIFGSAGTIYKTTDAGATWTQQTPSGITGIIYAGSMVDSLRGWCGGASGLLNYTSDGGATWTTQTSGLGTSTLYSISAISPTVAYLSGASSKASKTTDGGVTWTLMTMPAIFSTSTTQYCIEFFNEQYGAVSGSSGRIAITMDGGTTWVADNTNNNLGALYSVKIAEVGSNVRAAFVVGATAFVFKHSAFTVPVELTALTANVSGTQVVLRWSTATEINNRGFAVERRTESTSFEEISFVNGNGTTTEARSYSYTDNVINGKYIYRLRQVDFDGTVSFSKEVEADVTAPVEFALSQNYPNPFNPVTVIKYAVPVDGFVTLSVYNLLGEKVAQLVNGEVKSGTYEVSFDASGLSSGVYMYKLESGSFNSSKKLVLMK